MQRGEHAGIGEPEIPEVEVPRVLAAEHRAGLRHLGLDIGVTDPGEHRVPAVLGDDLRHRAGRDQVVDDRRTRLASQLARCDQRGKHRGRDDLASFVHHEAPVGVPVEGEPDVRVVLHHGALEVTHVLRVDGVRLVVRERAVQLEVERDQRDRQALEDPRDRVTGHPVARVDHHRQRPDPGDVDQLPQVIRVAGQKVTHGHSPGALGWYQGPFGQSFNVFQACLDADGPGARQAQLDAVVPRRVVAGRDHRAGDAQIAAGVVQHVGRAEAPGQHIGALGGRATAEGVRERSRGGAHVVHGHDRAGGRQPGEGRADRLGHALVKLVGHHPPDVVCLEDAREIAHRSSASRDKTGTPLVCPRRHRPGLPVPAVLVPVSTLALVSTCPVEPVLALRHPEPAVRASTARH
jgi:hypothetical protein